MNFNERRCAIFMVDVECANPPSKNHVGCILDCAVRAPPITSRSVSVALKKPQVGVLGQRNKNPAKGMTAIRPRA
ncbi:MAG: hypothetical protein WBL39_10285, partial [Terrimicrobiaceae bacterium]